METRKVQRVFEKLAKESWMMWTTGIYGTIKKYDEKKY